MRKRGLTQGYGFVALGAWLGVMLLLPIPAPGAQGEPQQPPAKGAAAPPAVQPLHPLVLDPFYLVREEDSRCWVERVLVEVEMAGLDPHAPLDLSAPEYRKVLYEYLNSKESGHFSESEVRNALNQQARGEVVRTVRISRSTLIVR
jgi:hypothetical protein